MVHIASPATLIDVLNMSRKWSIPSIIDIMSNGSPTDINSMFMDMIAADGIPAALIDAITAVSITVIRADVPKSRPYACVANIIAQPCIMAFPSIFIVAPRGMENDENSSDTPKSESFSNVNGIVALDDVDENAKSITGENFLKNLIGLNFVDNINNRGYIIIN